MATINAYKMDGLGNDFIIIDRKENHIELSKDKIIELGKRSNIGFDQIIYIDKEIENQKMRTNSFMFYETRTNTLNVQKKKRTLSKKGRHFCEFCENDTCFTRVEFVDFPKD